MGLYYRGTCLRTAMTLVGPYCHPLHVQSSPCSSRLLTTLTTQEGGAPRTASEPRPQGGGRRRGLGRNEHEPLKMPVQSQAEGSTRVDWFGRGCVLGLTSPENNMTCGGIEGGAGQRWRVHTVGWRRHSQPWEAGAGGADGVVWFGRLEEEEDKR